MLTLEQLQQFLMVAKLTSFTKAAEALFVSHSTISRNISALEQGLGVSLLIRDTRSVSLTYAGRILYEKGSTLMRQLESMERDVQKAAKGVTGLLTVAATSFYGDGLFSALRGFRKNHPEVELILNYHSLDEIVQEVLYDRADMGITYSYALGSAKDQFDIMPIASGKFCIVASPDFDREKLKKYGTPKFGDIKVMALSGLRYEFLESLPTPHGQSSKTSPEMYQTASLESLMLQVKSGAGVVLLPEHVAREYGIGCQVVELECADTSYDIVFFSKKNQSNPTLPLFFNWYQEYNKTEEK